jgi:hypothetical protein
VTEEDFTEAAYARLVRLASKQYAFGSFVEWQIAPPRTVLWRHDLDFSVHRALALARIEADAGVRATYFLNLHSAYYNALESEVADRVREIIALGHELGLHFDPTFETSRDRRDALKSERKLLEDVFGVPVRSFSLHNPVVAGWSDDEDEVAGMVNVYGRGLRERFAYCSDSHGVWRHRRLHDVVEEAKEERLHVLTHPEWWVPEPLPPRDRVTRAIEGRAARTQERYDRVAAEILARDRK